MPKLSRALPKYRKHRGSGQAVVTLCGVDHYLGPHGTKASTLEYDRLVAEWLVNGRMPLLGVDSITVVELISRYWQFCQEHYRKDGQLTGEVNNIRAALRPLKDLYGPTSASDFGPLALEALRSRMVGLGWSRRYVNQSVNRVRRMFRWGVRKQLLSAGAAEALAAVEGLRRGRTTARETAPVLPVEDAIVDATLPQLPPVVADMVRLQRLTGMRPAEVCMLRPMDLDRTADVWKYRPASHKTEHHGRDRVVFIGAKAQGILLRYLARDAATFCFRPCDTMEKHLAERQASRTTPFSCGNRPGSNRARKPTRAPGDAYDTKTYGRAIARAVAKAFPHPTLTEVPRRKRTGEQSAELTSWNATYRWSPNQLRHAAATEVRREFGLEAAQVVLGHSKADVTQVYAERDMAKGLEVARAIG